ncbi:MAG TPA: outer membrane beta-barrel protein [Bacteroidia bacterium]|nr:outer membrane beta-barrel protein [Bacteroidia bacterium]
MRMRYYVLLILFVAKSFMSSAQDSKKDSAIAPTEPFAFADFTWLNGNDRRHTDLLDSKYFTGRVLIDVNATWSNQNPIDHTVIGSTSLARNDEMEVSDAAFGGDFHYDNVRASILLQLGTRSTVLPPNDLSTFHGQYDLQDVYRYFSEGNAGYHFNVWHGINVDAGLFTSYIGMFSWYNAENWAYQPSFVSDNTPWFFNGLRIQTFPSDKLKLEYWIVNGWQSYAMYNNEPGFGCQVLWRPVEWFQGVLNLYYGADQPNEPGRHRFHNDNSIELRYYNKPSNNFISRCAFSMAGDIGFEQGDGVNGFHGDSANGPAQFFVGGMFYNRIWFGTKQHIGWTFGGGFIHNPGRYLVLAPSGMASPLPSTNYVPGLTPGSDPFTENPGDQFTAWDCSTTFDYMPKENVTWRVELVHREASVPYFNGPGGVTSPSGYTTTPIPPGWTPDLVKQETRIIVALLVRF